MVANPLWAPLGDSFGLIFAPFADLEASSAIFITFKPSLLRFLIVFLLASFEKSSFSLERVIDFEVFVFFS